MGLSVHNPETSLRRAFKALLLLEDHAQSGYMHCRRCIIKHALTAEGLAEEAVSLSGGSPRAVHALDLVRYVSDVAPSHPIYEVAARARQARKGLEEIGVFSVQ